MAKTLMFSSVSLFFMDTPAAQIATLMLVILIYAMAHSAIRPFTDTLVDRVAFVGHVAVFLMLLCALVLATGSALPGALVAGVPFVPLAIGALAFVYIAVELLCRAWKRRRPRGERTARRGFGGLPLSILRVQIFDGASASARAPAAGIEATPRGSPSHSPRLRLDDKA